MGGRLYRNVIRVHDKGGINSFTYLTAYTQEQDKTDNLHTRKCYGSITNVTEA